MSLYLDITHNGKRWPEFLNIHIHKKKPTPEDTEKKRIAQDIRSKREHELIVSDHGLTDKRGKRADFVKYMVEFFSQRARNGHRTGTLYQLRLYLGDKSLPIAHVNAKWLKEFEKFLLKTLKTTSVMTYMRNINSVLNEMVRKQIIPRNPWHEIPQHERMKVKESMRTCWTIEQL